jgi:hypothetical protein
MSGSSNGLGVPDPRWRYNMRKLLACAIGRNLSFDDAVTVYSSVRDDYSHSIYDTHDPEKNICGSFLVKNFVRNAKNEEKQVDVSLAVDMVAHATRLHIEAQLNVRGAAQRKKDVVFTVLTGDVDLMPAVNMVLSYGMQVNVCAFKDSLSIAYIKLAETNPDLKLTTLDGHAASFSFYSFHSTCKTFERNNTVSIDLPEHDHRSTIVSEICCHLLKIKELFFVVDDDVESAKLSITFPDTAATLVIPKLNSLLNLPIAAYNSATEPVAEPVTPESTNIFSVLEHEDSDDGAAGSSCGSCASDSDGAEDEFTVVSVKRQDRHARELAARRIGVQCPHGLHCPYSARCKMVHTDGEKLLFSRFSTVNFTLWKAQMCRSPHTHPADACSYAHSESDSWCVSCRRFGHSTKKCKFAAVKNK